MHTFPTPDPLQVVVRTGAGRVTVTATDTTETTVQLTGMNAGGEESAAAATVEHRDGFVVVAVPRRSGGFFRISPQVDVAVSCPSGSTVKVKAEAADLRAEGRFEAVDLQTGSGDIDVEQVGGPARLKTGSGAVRTGAVDGPLHVSSGSGDVSVDRSGTVTQVSVGSGDISIGEVVGEVMTKTGSGDLEVGVLDGALVSKTGSGALTVRRASSGTVSAKGASGSIDIGIPEGTAAWLDLSTVSGRVHQELGESAGPRADQRRVEITAHTVSGDLRVHRA